MKAPWFRFYSEAITDRKLSAVTSMTEQPPVVVIGAWITILCVANDSPIRGNLLLTENHPIKVAQLANIMGLDRKIADKLIATFIDLGMLDDDDGTLTVTAWHSRQFSSDYNAERMAKSRARKRDVTVTSQDGNRDVSETETDTETETDKSLTASPPPVPEMKPKPKRATKEPLPELLVTSIPNGTELQAVLDSHFAGLPRPIPAWKAFASGTQRKAYVRVAAALNGEFARLAESGLAKGASDRGRLLSWLEGCVKKHKENPGGTYAARQQPIANPSGNPNAGRFKHAPFDPTRERVKPIS